MDLDSQKAIEAMEELRDFCGSNDCTVCIFAQEVNKEYICKLNECPIYWKAEI